ncbi:MAG: peptidoglycan DD-metalloendopeptidase family protein [Sulfurimonadaceae bacterium]|jgi:septal ring factor EnvC (AmiA/AmiB activator)|nr:peptidoglycan DD-metalloendopeptidase family protein [Sulfurimonadaceae bacterium]
MHIFYLVLFFVITLQANIDVKIKNTNKELSSFSKDYQEINKKMAQTAKDILEQKNTILRQQKYLQELQEELTDKEKSYEENKHQLVELKTEQKKLKSSQEKIEEELVFTIAQSVSLSIILEEEYIEAEESLIEFEVLQEMLQQAKQKANQLNRKFYATSKDIDILSNQKNTLEGAITSIDAKRVDLIKTQEKNKKALQELETAKNSYLKDLKKLLGKQDELKRTLAQLNIIKIDAIKKAEEDRLRKDAFESTASRDTNLPDVKKHGSSYQQVKTKKYTGAKTIAPLDNYSVTKKYGTYTDPIYGIKIFNESISLKPNETDAKVKTVFNGKVIYADKTAVLNNIVIVEHDSGLHTIYANLSDIAPNIKKGVKIKKGYTIGRVDEELIFEVTQQSFHINPITIFQ